MTWQGKNTYLKTIIRDMTWQGLSIYFENQNKRHDVAGAQHFLKKEKLRDITFQGNSIYFEK